MNLKKKVEKKRSVVFFLSVESILKFIPKQEFYILFIPRQKPLFGFTKRQTQAKSCENVYSTAEINTKPQTPYNALKVLR